ncbi:MAG: DUF429 domain-containing protein [Myxococcota bacterium]
MSAKRQSLYVGVDGCKGGWVAVRFGPGSAPDGTFAARFTDLESFFQGAVIIGVDMPMGLAENGERAADHAARTFLGARRSSIFMTPVRAAVYAETYEEANGLNRTHAGKGLSKQAWNLVPKIRELDALTDPRLHEVHPEVAFACLAGEPLEERKKTWGGLQRRLALLEARGLTLHGPLAEASAVPIDDVVDAAVCALAAMDIHHGHAQRLSDKRPSIWGARPVSE